MKMIHFLSSITLVFILTLSVSAMCSAAPPAGADLAGFWEARRFFGPEVEGRLDILPDTAGWRAEISGQRATLVKTGETYRFVLPTGDRFAGAVTEDGVLAGHWYQRPSAFDGNIFAAPLRLEPTPTGGWRGQVDPLRDEARFFLEIRSTGEALSAEWFNPERNLGVFADLSRATLEEDVVKLYGRFRGRGEEQVQATGVLHRDRDVLTIFVGNRGGSYDFRRASVAEADGFLARPEGDSPFRFTPPAELEDGWTAAAPDEAELDLDSLRQLIETEILPRPADTHSLSIRALLVAHRGKLIVEEYFHGHHRQATHDSRSASKSVTALLAAVVSESGAPLSWTTPVFPLFARDDLVAQDPRKADITFEHLLTMSSGLDCDDDNPDSRGNEDVLWDNAESLDFYTHALELPVVGPAGSITAYCSASSNLAGGAIAQAAGDSIENLTERLLTVPMQFGSYYLIVPPDGHAYMGGGSRWRSRDFLKFSQLIVDRGVWNGQRIVSEESIERLVTPHVSMRGGRQYGYLWWVEDYSYPQSRNPQNGQSTVRAYYMAGNGGQISMAIPELDLAVVFQASNYSDPVSRRITEEIIPRYVLPAVPAGSVRPEGIS